MANKLTNLLTLLFSRKRKAELGMQFTISGSAKLLKKIRKKLRDEKSDKKEEKKDLKLVEEGAEFYDLDEVIRSFEDFLNTFLDEQEELKKILKKTNTVEFRIEEQIQEFIDEFKELAKEYDDAVLPELVNSVTDELNQINGFVKTEKQRAHDITFGHDRFRDKSIMPFVMIYHKLRRVAKKTRREVKHTEKIDSHMEKILKILKKNKHDKSLSSSDGVEVKNEIKELRTLLKEEKNNILIEFKDLILLEKFLVVLEMRSKDRLKEIQDFITAVKSKQGLPQRDYNKLVEEAKDTWNQLHKWEKAELATTKVIYNKSD